MPLLKKDNVKRFFISSFFHQTTSPGLKGMSRNDFKLFANIRGVIYIGNDSAVMNTLGSLLESFWIRQFFTHKSHVPKKLNNYSQF